MYCRTVYCCMKSAAMRYASLWCISLLGVLCQVCSYFKYEYQLCNMLWRRFPWGVLTRKSILSEQQNSMCYFIGCLPFLLSVSPHNVNIFLCACCVSDFSVDDFATVWWRHFYRAIDEFHLEEWWVRTQKSLQKYRKPAAGATN